MGYQDSYVVKKDGVEETVEIEDRHELLVWFGPHARVRKIRDRYMKRHPDAVCVQHTELDNGYTAIGVRRKLKDFYKKARMLPSTSEFDYETDPQPE